MKEMEFSELCSSQLFGNRLKHLSEWKSNYHLACFWAKAGVENNCTFCREMHRRQVLIQTLLTLVLFISLGTKTFGTQCVGELAGAGLWEEDSATSVCTLNNCTRINLSPFLICKALMENIRWFCWRKETS